MKYRFKPKCYGWGFVPVSWEGRLFTLFLLLCVLASAHVHGLLDGSIEHVADPVKATLSYLLDIILIVFAFSWFMDKKTDGELKWRRGKDN